MSPVPTERDHEAIRELLGVFALDAVDAETAAIVARHLDGCVRCSVEVAQYHEVASLMANTGGASPAHLWDGIASRLDRSAPPAWADLAQRLGSDPELSERVEGLPDPQPHGENAIADPESTGSNVIPITAHRRARRPATIAVGAAAVVASVVGVALVVPGSPLDQRMTASPFPGLLTQAEQSALHAPSTKQVQLTSVRSSRGGNAVGTVTVVLTASGTGFVEAGTLAALPRTETYQLWGVVGRQTISLGLLGSDPSVIPFSAAGNMPVTAFAITAEHSGGVVQSSNKPVVAGEVTD